MKWTSVVLVGALLCQALYLPCQAQEGASDVVAVGSRVRITRGRFYSQTRLVGTVEGMDDNTLVLLPEKQASSLTISLASAKRLEVSVGRKGDARKGAFVGFLSGASIGFLLSVGQRPWSVSPAFVWMAAPLGLLGLGLGAAIGKKRERWEEVPLAHLSLSTRSHGIALSFNLEAF